MNFFMKGRKMVLKRIVERITRCLGRRGNTKKKIEELELAYLRATGELFVANILKKGGE